jgi:UDP-N-acetyl-D-galactosamine dehydrogenase
MGFYVAEQVVKLMIKKGHTINASQVLILGITFKENCPDVRNSRVIDIITELQQYGCQVDVYDPWADSKEVKREYGIDLVAQFSQKMGNKQLPHYDAIVLAVAHNEFKTLNLKPLKNNRTVIYDVKGILAEYDGRL